MYNGIGLVTPRGSGTNGYVVRNLSHLRTHNNDSQRGGPAFDSAPPKHREPDQSILDHEKKRKVEVKCFELRVELEDQEVPEEDIETQVAALRKRLLDNMAAIGPTSAKHLKPSDTHGLLAAKKSELNKLASALGTRSNYVEGDAFNREKQEQLKKLRAEEREANDKLREEARKKRDAEREAYEKEKKEKDRLRRREEDRIRKEKAERSKREADMPPPPKPPMSQRPIPTGPRRPDTRDFSRRSPPPPPPRPRRNSRSMSRSLSRSRSPPPRPPPRREKVRGRSRSRSPPRRSRTPRRLSRSPMRRSYSPAPARRSRSPTTRRGPPRGRSPRSRSRSLSRSSSGSPPPRVRARRQTHSPPKESSNAPRTRQRSTSVSSGSAMNESD